MGAPWPVDGVWARVEGVWVEAVWVEGVAGVVLGDVRTVETGGRLVVGTRTVVGTWAVVEGPPRGGGRSANSASLFSATRLLTYWWACPREGSSCPDFSASKLYDSTDPDE